MLHLSITFSLFEKKRGDERKEEHVSFVPCCCVLKIIQWKYEQIKNKEDLEMRERSKQKIKKKILYLHLLMLTKLRNMKKNVGMWAKQSREDKCGRKHQE